MFGNYPDRIKYIKKSEKKDMFGYGKEEAIETNVRYVGGEDVYVPDGDKYRVEHRLIFHCEFEVNVEDKFIFEDRELTIKKSLPCRNVWGKTHYWRVEGV